MDGNDLLSLLIQPSSSLEKREADDPSTMEDFELKDSQDLNQVIKMSLKKTNPHLFKNVFS